MHYRINHIWSLLVYLLFAISTFGAFSESYSTATLKFWFALRETDGLTVHRGYNFEGIRAEMCLVEL